MHTSKGTSDIDRLLEAGRDKEAFDLSRQRAADGDGAATVVLGWMYHVGRGVQQDHTKAAFWYQQALESESLSAEFYLGTLHWTQGAVSEAVEWFQKSAARGFQPAAYRLARMYRYGFGVTPDRDRARRYTEEAAAMGHVLARRDLCYEQISGDHGAWQIPVGLARLLRLGWQAFRIAMKDSHDPRLLRL